MAFQVVSKDRVARELAKASSASPSLSADELHAHVAGLLGIPVEDVMEIANSLNPEGSPC